MPSINYTEWSGSELSINCNTSDIPSGGKLEVEVIGYPYNNYSQVFTLIGASTTNVVLNFNPVYSYVTFQIRIREQNSSWSDPLYTYPADTIYPETKYPSYYPEITDQYVKTRNNLNWYEAGSCVANALATVKEIHEYLEGKGEHNQYSIGWIYGNRLPSHSQNEGMMYAEALSKLQSDGVPMAKLIPENQNYFDPPPYAPRPPYPGDLYYPDVYFYTSTTGTGITAKQLVQNNYNDLIDYAKPQRISSYTPYNEWEVEEIKKRVIEDGCVLYTLDLYDNFYHAAESPSGIIPQYKSGSFVDGHAVVIMGWKRIGVYWYWICQNSWGEWYGDEGLIYIPFYNDYPSATYFIRDGNYPYPAPPTPNPPTVIERFEGGYKLSWNLVSGVESYTLKVRRSYDNHTYTFSTSDTLYEVIGLQFGVTHYVSVRANGEFSSSNYSSEYPATTSPKTPTLSFTSKTADSVIVTVENMEGNWDAVDVTLNSTTKIVTINNTSVTFTGLTSNQTYTVTAKSRFYINGTTLYSVNTASLIVDTDVRTYFSWDTPKIQGQPFNITATEWNGLVQNVKDVHVYKLGSYNSSQYPMTTVTSGNQIKALYFNQVKFAIGSLNATGISDKSAGNAILASDLNTIIEKLNTIE